MIKEIKIMTSQELADYIISRKTGDIIEFAISKAQLATVDIPENVEQVESWYFAQIIERPDYQSRFLIIDYCGGLEACAYPLSNLFSETNPDYWKNEDFDSREFGDWIAHWMNTDCEEKHGFGPDMNDKGQYIVYVDITKDVIKEVK